MSNNCMIKYIDKHFYELGRLKNCVKSSMNKKSFQRKWDLCGILKAVQALDSQRSKKHLMQWKGQNKDMFRERWPQNKMK